MSRLWLIVALATALTACTGSSYTVEGANIENANERATRYCGNQDATAELEQVHQKGSTSVQTYRCIAVQ